MEDTLPLDSDSETDSPVNIISLFSDQLSFELPLIEDSVSEAESDDSFLTTMATVETDQKNKMFQFPPFEKEDPDFWFTRIDSVFQIHGVTTDELKFLYMLAQAPEELVPYIAAASKKTPASDITKYTAFKKQVIESFSISEETKLRSLFRGLSLENKKPTQ